MKILNVINNNHNKEEEIIRQIKTFLEKNPVNMSCESITSDVMNAHFTEEEVMNVIIQLKNKKACGLDGSPCEALKAASPIIISPSTSFLNYLLDIGEYPSEWVEGCDFPVPKSKDPKDPNNYKRKTAVPVLRKLFGVLFNKRQHFVKVTNLIVVLRKTAALLIICLYYLGLFKEVNS